MSNQVVGQVYLQIIDRVATESKDDFESAALDSSTLQDLKTQWQNGLTMLGVAAFPWDPQPQPSQQAISNPPTVPSNAKPEQQTYKTEQQPYKTEQYKSEPSGSSTPVQRPAQATTNGSETAIKQEPGTRHEQQSYPAQAGYSNGMTPAQQRANQLLSQQYGSQANASIQASQRQMQVPGGQRPTHIQMPPRPGQSQYPQQQPSVGPAQTDGAADDAMEMWKATLAERRAVTKNDQEIADRQLREYLEASCSFEESGLLVPLSQKPRVSKKQRCRSSLALHSVSEAPAGIAQLDGEFDDKSGIKREDDEDEDAINSDLDDSDDGDNDGADDEDEGGPMGETILCTYDKVQRVKNKWKCTLKDGIFLTGKKEYVFHKATGEFEW